jgi:hypothetical protein
MVGKPETEELFLLPEKEDNSGYNCNYYQYPNPTHGY